MFSLLKSKLRTKKIICNRNFARVKCTNTLYFKMDPISTLFVVKIATYFEAECSMWKLPPLKCYMWKLQWLGVGWLAGWLVGWLVVGTPKLLRTSFSCQSLFKRAQPSANISRVFSPFNLLWFVGNMSPSPSSQIGVPSKALGAVGSCGWVKGRSEKEQHWLCARCSNKSRTISSLFDWVKANVRSTQISLPRFLGIRSFGLSP